MNELEKWLAEAEAACEKATRNCHRNGYCVATVEGGEQGIVNYDDDGNQCVQHIDRYEKVKVGEFGNEDDAEFDVRARAALPLALKIIRAGLLAGAGPAMRAAMNAQKPDIVSGLSCSGCGIRFVEPHGHPVLCAVCYDDFYSGADAIEGNHVPPSQRLRKATNKEAAA